MLIKTLRLTSQNLINIKLIIKNKKDSLFSKVSYFESISRASYQSESSGHNLHVKCPFCQELCCNSKFWRTMLFFFLVRNCSPLLLIRIGDSIFPFVKSYIFERLRTKRIRKKRRDRRRQSYLPKTPKEEPHKRHSNNVQQGNKKTSERDCNSTA